MRWTVAAACVAMLAVASVQGAEAKGCIKGAIVGEAAGHMAGHGKLGAAVGCVVGHREANKTDAQTRQTRERLPVRIRSEPVWRGRARALRCRGERLHHSSKVSTVRQATSSA